MTTGGDDATPSSPSDAAASDSVSASEAGNAKGKLGSTALRFASALPLIPVILWLLFYGPRWGFHAFAFLAIAIVARELMAMTMPGQTVLIGIGTLATLGFAATVVFAPAYLFPAVLGLGMVALVASLLRPEPIETAGARTGWLFGGPIYIGGLLVTVDLLHGLPFGARWVVLAMMLAFLSDTAAYFAGRAFGKHKLYEKLSPKKTIEGSLGGLVGAVGGAFFALYVMKLPIPVPHAVALGVVAGGLGQAGDLLESLLKRSAGVKDSGNILPGHGGLLDRVDALMFTAATTWAYAVYVLDAR
ncbi:MAG: phosphatidate cytidylyltransferase [Polyangiales bacterium]|nr:phosphatidate cytidylyltransferase [Paracoccaceae bacterium]MCB9659880.1 phosphatidate cytidylyltransferase [Sandaracinaceae bacterium]